MTEAEMITSELGGGLTAVATLSTVTDLTLASSKPPAAAIAAAL